MTHLRYPRRLNPVSPLGRAVGASPRAESEMLALRRRAWQEAGIVVVRPEDLDDEATRRLLIDLGSKLFGSRRSQV